MRPNFKIIVFYLAAVFIGFAMIFLSMNRLIFEDQLPVLAVLGMIIALIGMAGIFHSIFNFLKDIVKRYFFKVS